MHPCALLSQRSHLLGVGTYGIVFAVGSAVAVKVSRKASGCGEEFANEQKTYQVLGRNKSPYILPYFVLIPGQATFLLRAKSDLRAVLQSPQYTFQREQGVRWMAQICAGVAFMESQGYAHGDLRPGNILMDAHGNMRLFDLGSALPIGGARLVGTEPFARQLTREEMQDGSVHYGEAGPRSETFALGSIWYSILRGHYPGQEEGKDGKDGSIKLRPGDNPEERRQYRLARRAAFREKRFPALDLEGSADDQIVHRCWHGQYATVAALEQEFRGGCGSCGGRDGADGGGSPEWYRFEGESDEYLAEQERECTAWVAGGGLDTLPTPFNRN
ncbi:hypothetical protein SCUCBS95973_007048 [Sporothrix curviconia]|uniref:Protein kinase domain-containing protein n=1 Tax=Sporothrix curviconia TaxID=1260050 RepID=A0ABP0CAU4_9PEZI